MKINTGLLLIILSILTNSCSAQQGHRHAPEATAVEATLSFWDIPILEDAFIDVAPANRNDDILVGELDIDGGNKDMILKLAKEIVNNKQDTFDSFLIAYKDKLLFESYYMRGRINLPHPQASATKGHTSLLLGRAMQLGYLTMADLDKPLVSFLKDLDPTKFVDGAEKISLHQALTMRGGLNISTEKKEAFEKDTIALKGQGLVQVLLENSAPITAESQHFLYGNYNPRLVMQVIEAVVPGSAQEFIKTEFFDKLGITNYSWENEISGLPAAGWRSSITSRAMVKLGVLVMNKGKWEGEQLISEAYIAKAVSPILYTGNADAYGGGQDVVNEGYGYYWWNAELKHGGKSYFSTSAQGGGGQYIVVIEELDLIVVATGHNNDGNSVLQIIAERVIPAFVH